MAATADLSTLTRTLNSTTGGFRTAANQNNMSINRVVKDLGSYFSSQKSQLGNLGIALKSQSSDSADVARQVSQTNTLMRQTLGLQKEMLTALKALDKSVKSISSSSGNSGSEVDPKTGMLSRFASLGIGGVARGAAVAAAPYALGAAGVAAGGYLGFKGFQRAYNNEAVPGEDDGKSAYKLNIGSGDNKREVNISEKDIERLAKIVKAEAGGNQEGVAGRQAVMDTVLNRVASGNKSFGAQGGVRGVINQPKQFSPINGIGDVDKLPTTRELEQFKKEVRDYLAAKSQGRSQLGKDYTMFANPSASDAVNQNGWVGAMQRDSASKQFGRHVHGVNNNVKVPDYSISSSNGDDGATPKGASNQAAPQGSSAGGEDAKKMLQQRQSGGRGFTGVNSDKLNSAFATKLSAAIQAAEQATGDKIRITEGYRDPGTQAQYYADYKGIPITYGGKTYQPDPSKKGRLAAPPGRSNHQRGTAVDIASGPAREWLRKNGSRFGIKDLGSKDMPHFELAGGGGGEDATPSSGANDTASGTTPKGGSSDNGSEGSSGAQAGQMPADQARAIAGVGMGRGGFGLGGATGGIGGLLGSAVNGLLGTALRGGTPQASLVQPNSDAAAPATAQLNQSAVQSAAREAAAQDAAVKPTPVAATSQASPQTNINMASAKEDDFTSGNHVSAPWADKLLDSYYRNPQGIQTA